MFMTRIDPINKRTRSVGNSQFVQKPAGDAEPLRIAGVFRRQGLNPENFGGTDGATLVWRNAFCRRHGQFNPESVADAKVRGIQFDVHAAGADVLRDRPNDARAVPVLSTTFNGQTDFHPSVLSSFG